MIRRLLHPAVSLIVALAAVGAMPAPTPSPGGATTERFGPFLLGSLESLSVRVEATFLPDSTGTDPDDSRRLQSWRVTDQTGRILYEADRRSPPAPGQINDIDGMAAFSARALRGGSGRFLLVELGYSPSAPGSGLIYLVFGAGSKGNLRAVARFEQQGAGVKNEPSGGGEVLLSEGKYVDVGVWTGYFEMTFRYEYDATSGRFVPTNNCSKVAEVARDPDVTAERVRAGEDAVELFVSPDAKAHPERLKISAASSVEFLQACVPLAPENGGFDEQRLLPELYLQVRIDGRMGWVRETDFARLGLLHVG